MTAALRRTIVILALAGLLGAAGVAIGSNMAFRFRASFPFPGRDHWLSLPYHSEYERAQDVCDAIGPAATLVSRFDSETKSRIDWTCPFGANFRVAPGEGLMVRVSAPASAVFSGRDDPNLAVPAGGFIGSGHDHLVSIPYNTTALVAQDLCEEAGLSLVSRFDSASASVVDWTCPFGENFAIVPGQAYRLRTRDPAPPFVPAHY